MMTENQPPRDAANQDTATIRALSSITSRQAETIMQTVRGAALTWDVLTFDDYDGYLSLLIQPAVQDDEQKAFSITGTAQRLELSQVYGDDVTPLAKFSNVDVLIARLMDLISQ